jgi:diphthine-ammonia ligase
MKAQGEIWILLMKLSKQPEKVASVLWTGGKDCSLAFYEAEKLGYKIINLVTFVPPHPDFIAHPLEFLKIQAESIGVPYHIVTISGNMREEYIKAFKKLQSEQGITALVTGDIAEIGDFPNWVKECCKGLAIDVVMPLWGLKREEILNKLVTGNFKTMISCVKRPGLPDELVGRTIDINTLENFTEDCRQAGIDICGEQGEYHTLVLDAPMFIKQIHVKKFSRHKNDLFTYLRIEELMLSDKS